jgi:predicted RND superfamily exporter protein
MSWKTGIVRFSVDHPGLIVSLTIAAVAVAVCLGAVRGYIAHWEIVDTDPENMLAPTEEVRVFHNSVKREFLLHDMVIIGIVNESDPDGVFNPSTLSKIFTLTGFIDGLDGVISADVIAPSEVDDIEHAGPGVLKFERLMESPPADRAESISIQKRAKNQPMLYGTLLSEDAKAICLYVPIREKKLSHKIAAQLREEANRLGMKEMDYRALSAERGGKLSVTGDVFGITGLPVAEDTFGVEMFAQMAISAPLAMLIIFLLMFLFFRKIVLILSPMMVAVASVLITMGLLIGLGNTVHIMSSMIPIFLMPIAVVDSVHILSEFFDRYRRFNTTRKAILAVMEELFTPMLYTSLTSAAGFASLALTPIPPVQTFGLFVACGIMFAWILTVTFIPAYTTFIPEKRLETFGADHDVAGAGRGTPLSRMLGAVGRIVLRRAKLILGITALVTALSVYGISLIVVNDNPTRWFVSSHPIRVADRVLNSHFGGTYMAYLVLEPRGPLPPDVKGLEERLRRFIESYRSDDFTAGPARRGEIEREVSGALKRISRGKLTQAALVGAMSEWVLERADEAPDGEYPIWDAMATELGGERARADIFKRPEMLRYVGALEKAILDTDCAGKTSSAATMVKYVYRELRSGREVDYVVPPTARGVAECYIQAQSGHDPEDLWHLVTPDYEKVNVWVQLKSGDNRDMESVVNAVDRFMTEHPPPVPLLHRWAGLTYVNMVWQDKMVSGMLRSLLGSFVIVLFMMVFLFRSFVWGLLCMIPLSVTIAFIYGMIGFAGKDYDMPVAVLSSLTLGLSVDFAIHYLQRAREIFARVGNWEGTAEEMAGEPARAITRNAIVIAVGFLPLLAAPLVPYKTVGFFLATIMAVSGVGTLVILPALVSVLQRVLFVPRAPAAVCNCAACAVTGVVAVCAVAFVFHRYGVAGWTWTTITSAVLVVAAMLACNRLSRREACLREEGK